MPDPSDLAATLRRFLADPKAKVGSVPVAVLPHDFVAEVASALERGAAAEAALEAGKAYERAMVGPHRAGRSNTIAVHAELEWTFTAHRNAIAAYWAIKEASNG